MASEKTNTFVVPDSSGKTQEIEMLNPSQTNGTQLGSDLPKESDSIGGRRITRKQRIGGKRLHMKMIEEGQQTVCGIDSTLNELLNLYSHQTETNGTTNETTNGTNKIQSCISANDLRKIYIQIFTENITDENRKKKITEEAQTMDAKKLWKIISENFRSSCGSAKHPTVCWLTKSELRGTSLAKQLLSERFKPLPPNHSQGWLSNFDIYDIMKQIQNVYPEYLFIGPVSVDYDKYLSELISFSIRDIVTNQGKAKIGIIWNLDLHTGPGTHWVATYITISAENNIASIEYYNSVGKQPPENIQKFLNQVELDILKLFPSMSITKKVNDQHHQHENSECGIFSINYILARLNGMTADEIFESTSDFTDSTMAKFRNFFFLQNK